MYLLRVLFIQYTGELKELGKDAGYGTTSQTTSIQNISGIYSNRTYLNLKLPDNIEVQAFENYWLRKDGSMINFKNKKQYLEIFPGIEDKLDEFIKDNKIRFRDRDDLKKLVKYTNLQLSQ